ncbi:unnamed protein product [Enterobius vermicularis]|uniref:Calmodulin n=1 Tax=Enterobius vermicularis TaxID=51028 RepID=A0A0N4VNR0_ENTVE|nr:unnamed protein product [Enterobius vermicularis]
MCFILSHQHLNEAFALLDTDHDGRLSRTELAAVFRAINVEPTRVEMDCIFKEMDTDANGKISKEEFIRYMSEPPKHRTSINELEEQFRMFDGDGDGCITLGKLSHLLYSIVLRNYQSISEYKRNYILGLLIAETEKSAQIRCK